MNIKNEIISFDPTTGTILVRYFTDDIQPGYTFNIDLPIVDGMLPLEDQLQQTIDLYSPRIQFERIEAMKIVNIPQYLKNLIPITSE